MGDRTENKIDRNNDLLNQKFNHPINGSTTDGSQLEPMGVGDWSNTYEGLTDKKALGTNFVFIQQRTFHRRAIWQFCRISGIVEISSG